MSHSPLDPRRNAVRADLADAGLRGQVETDRFVEGVRRRVARPAVPLRGAPDHGRALVTEALFGETVLVFEERDGWAWVQLAADGYVGYLPADALAPPMSQPTHRVRALGTFVYPVPDIKAPAMMHLPLNALLSVTGTEDRFLGLATGGYVVQRHVGEIGRPARDFVEIAERFTGTPYLWGGKTRIGLDCSGLVQVSLQAAGIAAPRDSDMQECEIGASLLVPETLEGLERGDLVFWPGHVGIMADGILMVHANAHHMAVAVEPLAEAARRIARLAGHQIRTIRRPPPLAKTSPGDAIA